MQQTTYNIKKPIGLGVMTALSVASLSTNVIPFSYGNLTASRNQPFAYEGVPLFSDYGGDLCTSSTLSDVARGDILTSEKGLGRYADR